MEKMSLEMFKKLEYLKILKKILDLDNPVKPSENNDKQLISLLEIIDKDDYVITPDNFRKMILILYRIIANIPVILMGETGCGKTALIKKLNQLLNNGKETLQTININPRYDDEKLTKEMNIINKKAKSCEGELWVFFDELNTCDSLSLITEIFINRTYGGKELENNIRLIGACNPYRKKKENKNICGLTYKNDDDNGAKLVYLVNILPQSLMYYVFNFGSLEKENEDQYISSIISDIIPEKKLKEATKNAISKCHDYLRETFDPSVVSLREMRRFKKIYNTLLKYFDNKKKLNPEKSGTEESNKLKSIIISIYLCYYSRLVDKTTRSNFDTEMKESFKKLVNYNCDENNTTDVIFKGLLKDDLEHNYDVNDFNQFHFSQILSFEQKFILNNISLSKGIGKNKSLKENIFLLFIALITNIPLIIIGKPGSSKSLSAQLIYKEMGGKYSIKEFFKYYPSIIQTYFQGSDSTTPKDVESVFEKAELRLKGFRDNNSEFKISMILFDELGLAERSKYNPLKALHSNLEIDGSVKEGKEKGISFIGISNWTLDAAKVNRALNLSVPDLDSDLDDLKKTSKSIAKSINDSFKSNKIFEKILPNVYFQFKENLKILKILTVYKQYELQEYKNLIDNCKEDEDFQKIFSDIEYCKKFFERKEDKDKGIKTDITGKEEDLTKIYEYYIFKKKRDKLKEFCEIKKEELKKKKLYYTPFEESVLNNKNYKNLYENDKKVKIDFLGNRDFYYLIKGIASEMNDNNLDYKVIIQKYIERNFGGFEITIDFENDYGHLREFEKYKDDIYKDFFKKISDRPKWSSFQIFEIIFNIYCSRNNEPDYLIDEANLDGFKYMENITDNVKDIKSRYLLLGINSSHASVIHQKNFKRNKKDYLFL
jgi:energy-coupling factor transporter ATP-binding protein EcfA2